MNLAENGNVPQKCRYGSQNDMGIRKTMTQNGNMGIRQWEPVPVRRCTAKFTVHCSGIWTGRGPGLECRQGMKVDRHILALLHMLTVASPFQTVVQGCEK